MDKQQQLNALVEPIVTTMGYEFVGSELILQGRFSIIRIYIDSKEGVTLDACSEVSRQISSVLDVEDFMTGRYTLEVSSPGVERRLFTLKQFEQFIGKNAVIRLSIPIEKRRNFFGKIVRVEDDQIVLLLEDEQQEIKLSFKAITKANLQEKTDFLKRGDQ